MYGYFVTFKNVINTVYRLYFKSLAKSETEKEKLLLAYQVNEEIVQGRFPVGRELAIEMAALMAQVCSINFMYKKRIFLSAPHEQFVFANFHIYLRLLFIIIILIYKILKPVFCL